MTFSKSVVAARCSFASFSSRRRREIVHESPRSGVFALRPRALTRLPLLERRRNRSPKGQNHELSEYRNYSIDLRSTTWGLMSLKKRTTFAEAFIGHSVIHLGPWGHLRAARLVHMFNATLVVVEAFIRELRTTYERTYGTMEPGYPGVISFVAQLALENIATSDASYHDVNHTIMVTLVGQEILRGQHISVGGVTPRDWLHFIISLLCHDIGYVRGICRGDGDGSYVTNLGGDKVTLPEGATDASLTPYHVARSKLFVRERSAKALVNLDVAAIEANIEHTRFPVPEDEQHESTDDFPGLVRAADLIGQLADINYLRKQAALFNEFRETGMTSKLKYNSVADLRANYPEFFWKRVRPYIGDALRHLRVTQEGQQWIANLYANVFSVEHRGQLS